MRYLSFRTHQTPTPRADPPAGRSPGHVQTAYLGRSFLEGGRVWGSGWPSSFLWASVLGGDPLTCLDNLLRSPPPYHLFTFLCSILASFFLETGRFFPFGPQRWTDPNPSPVAPKAAQQDSQAPPTLGTPAHPHSRPHPAPRGTKLGDTLAQTPGFPASSQRSLGITVSLERRGGSRGQNNKD